MMSRSSDVLGARIRDVDECFGAISSPRPLRPDQGKRADRSDSTEPELQCAASSRDLLLPLQFTPGTNRGPSSRLLKTPSD